jgi:hypothetical protein
MGEREIARGIAEHILRQINTADSTPVAD